MGKIPRSPTLYIAATRIRDDRVFINYIREVYEVANLVNSEFEGSHEVGERAIKSFSVSTLYIQCITLLSVTS